MSKLEDFADAFHRIWADQAEPDSALDIGSLTLAEAYDVQQLASERRQANGEQVAGYKVGCTSGAIRAQFGLTEPIAGQLFRPYVYEGETTLRAADLVQCAVEPEFVLCAGDTLTATFSRMGRFSTRFE